MVSLQNLPLRLSKQWILSRVRKSKLRITNEVHPVTLMLHLQPMRILSMNNFRKLYSSVKAEMIRHSAVIFEKLLTKISSAARIFVYMWFIVPKYPS